MQVLTKQLSTTADFDLSEVSLQFVLSYVGNISGHEVNIGTKQDESGNIRYVGITSWTPSNGSKYLEPISCYSLDTLVSLINAEAIYEFGLSSGLTLSEEERRMITRRTPFPD